jgi:hypothetical protein
MFTKLRTLSNNILVKALLIALAASLVIWGAKVGSGYKDYVAIIGKKNYIYKADFIRAKKNFLRNMRQTYDQQNLEDANVNQIILNNLIQNELLKTESVNLGLLISENIAFEEIKRMPIFKNSDGLFDKHIFKNALSANGISESKFVDSIKKELAVNILNSVFTAYSPSEDLIKEFFYHNEQKRVIDLITIRPSQEQSQPVVQNKDIEKYYHTNKERFAVPEYRDVEYITITPTMYKDKIIISDKELEDELKNINTSVKKDKSVLKKIKNNLLTTKIYKAIHDEIKVIEDEIAAGNSLKDVAKKHGLEHTLIKKLNAAGQSQKTQSLPKFEKFIEQTFSISEEIPSDTIAIRKNNVSAGYYILNVPRIYKSYYKPLEEVKNTVVTLTGEEQKERILREKALQIYNLVVSNKKTLEQVINKNPNVSLEKMTVGRTVQRGATLDTNLLTSIFKIKEKNSYTNVFKSREVYAFQFAKIKQIELPQNAPPLNKSKILNDQLSSYFTTAIRQEFLNYLYSKFDVKVFPKTLKEL